MGFRQEFMTSVKSGLGHQELLALVLRQEPDPRKAYKLLEGIWQDLGFDATEGGDGQDELEFVMEKLWYWSPASERAE